jgi:hypothetical protein
VELGLREVAALRLEVVAALLQVGLGVALRL